MIGDLLPDPKDTYRGHDEDRAKRMKFFAGVVIRLVLLIDAAFGGLLFAEADMTTLGAVAGSLLFAAVTWLVLLIALALIWNDSL